MVVGLSLCALERTYSLPDGQRGMAKEPKRLSVESLEASKPRCLEELNLALFLVQVKGEAQPVCSLSLYVNRNMLVFR